MELVFTVLCFVLTAFFVIRWAVHGADNKGVGRKRKK